MNVDNIIGFISSFARRVTSTSGEVRASSVRESTLLDIIGLDFSSSNVEKLPAGIGRLKNLRSLNLSRNKIRKFTALTALEELHTIHLNKCGLSSFPTELTAIPSLKKIYISRNQLTSIPREIDLLHRLDILNIRCNAIRSLPDELFHLGRLVELDASENMLKFLPTSIHQAKALKNFYVSGNDLLSVPDSIGLLRNLRSLALSVNNIKTLPASICGLQLKDFWIYDNPLISPPIGIAEGGLDEIRKYFSSSGTSSTVDTSRTRVFVSYAKEDSKAARQLYSELVDDGFDAWLDEENILPGQKWEIAVDDAIKRSTFFIAVLSSNSVEKRGYVQKELRRALDILETIPDRGIFIIPIRLDECVPSHPLIEKIQWVDMPINEVSLWNKGYSRIRSVLKGA